MEEKKDYGMFNGRRNADNYVKGYLKGILAISSIGLVVFMSFAGWCTVKIYNHETRIVKIESSRFSIKDGASLLDKINQNTIEFTKIDTAIKSLSLDMAEIKNLLRRTAPYERRDE